MGGFLPFSTAGINSDDSLAACQARARVYCRRTAPSSAPVGRSEMESWGERGFINERGLGAERRALALT